MLGLRIACHLVQAVMWLGACLEVGEPLNISEMLGLQGFEAWVWEVG